MAELATTAGLDEVRIALPGVLGEDDVARFMKAYQFATDAHAGKVRSSGETYADHGLAVAHQVAELGIDDVEALSAAILHDMLLPHTGQSEEALVKAFGRPVVNLIKGARLLDDYARRASENRPITELGLDMPGDQATLEAIRRALLSIIEGDIRIILLRMADCLQDLTLAGSIPPSEQRRLAYEAMHIYAPLANRLGIWHLKWQLEDQSFRYLEPQEFDEIATHLAELRAERSQRVAQAAARLERQLRDMGIKATVSGRSKHIYSIYRKMKRKRLDFEQIYDIQALRVVLEPADLAAYQKKSSKAKDDEDRALCYQVLGAVHSLWQPIPREFDDYIATPKANGYKSLHTAVIDPENGQKLEVQIRTQRMHEEAERGIAAHWAYKEAGAKVSASDQRRIHNLRELLATLQEVEESPDGAMSLDVDRLEERIYVFTPRGDVVDLPAGSTPIDFAYQIHTEVGHRCRGARVNGKMVSLDHKLKSGEQVEIITAKRGGPMRDWMNPTLGYTGSARTRSKVRGWFRTQDREQNVLQGREVVERELRRLALGDTFTVDDIAHSLKFDDVNEFLAKVGFGDLQTAQITGAITLLQQSIQPQDEELLPLLQPSKSRGGKGLTVRGVGGLHTKLAKCCNPIAPEPIVGFITRGEGVTIHRKDCKQLEAISERERLIEVDWGAEAETHPVPIVLEAYRRSGLIDDMVAITRGQQITVPKTKLATHDGIMVVHMIAEVTNLEQLNWLLTKLENLPNVIYARRERWT